MSGSGPPIARSTRWPRRRVLELAGATVLLAGGRSPRAAEPLLERAIPGRGERIPAVGLGTSDAFEVADGASRAPQREVLRRFAALGGRVVDTAPSYGNAESVIGALAGELDLRASLFLATKVDRRGAEAGVAQMSRSEQRLGRAPLDLIQVHNLIDVGTQLASLRRRKADGRVRYIGITHYRTAAFAELERLMRTESFDFVQLNYSVTTPDAEQRLLPLAADRGLAVLVNRPFEDGRLFRATRGRPLPAWTAEFDCASWAQFAIKYILSHPAVTCAIPATSKPEHLVDNMGGGLGRLPDAATRARMRAYAAEL